MGGVPSPSTREEKMVEANGAPESLLERSVGPDLRVARMALPRRSDALWARQPVTPAVGSAEALALAEGEGGVYECEVAEGLGEVAELAVADGVVFLGEQADVVAQIEEPLEQLAGLILRPALASTSASQNEQARKTPSPPGSASLLSSGR